MLCVRLCLVFNPLSTVLLRLEVFSVQVGCVYDKVGPSVKQKVFISTKIYLFQKSGLPLQLRFSNLAMKNPKMMSSCFIFITNNACSLRLLEKTWQQLFLWVINLCRSSCCVIFLLQSDCSEIKKVHNFSLVSLLYN